MAHQEQANFCIAIQHKFPEYFYNKKVLDCGSLELNASFKPLFTDCMYIGVDISSGKNVDVVSLIHELNFPDESFDTIISCETFEHDMFYAQSLQNIYRLLKSGGLFFFTCAAPGRPEHGTQKSESWVSPFTSNIPEWCNYYKNLDENDIRKVIDIDRLFEKYEFSGNVNPNDLYFWGIKK
jgi:ubiquinone/menaquinone biosynthesis C-methylase UbiE